MSVMTPSRARLATVIKGERMRRAFLLGPLGALALLACSHAAGITRLANAPPKPAGCQLELFDSEAAVGRPFEAVCLVDSEVKATLRTPVDRSAVAETARRAACDCGGDAMIVTQGAEGSNLVVKVIRFTGQ
jgi:hypothetical protein